MNKKIILGLAVLIIIVIGAAVFLFAVKNPEGKSGPENIASNIGITVIDPAENSEVSNPVAIRGRVMAGWFFEGSFPITVTDKNGSMLGRGIAKPNGMEWTGEGPIDFVASIDYVSSQDTDGYIVFNNDNPSGLSENQKEFKVSVKIKKTEEQQAIVKVFFGKYGPDSSMASCENVYSSERKITKTEAVARAAIEELLKGPTAEEKNAGLFTSINSGVKIQSLNIANNTAKIDFSDELERGVGGSCKVSAIRAQITQTLKQFPSVKNVVISINGRTEDILQP